MNLIGLTLMVMTLTMCGSNQAAAPSTPEEALAALIAGNERYVDEKSINPRSDMERVEETAPHQAPFAAVVGCSDSRVPVELLFDQGIGDKLFMSGNIYDSYTLTIRQIKIGKSQFDGDSPFFFFFQ